MGGRRQGPDKDYQDHFEYRSAGRSRRPADRRSGSSNSFEDVSSYSSERKYNKRKKGRKGKTALKSVVVVLCALAVIIGAFFIYASTYLFKGLTTTSVPKDLTEIGINSGVTSDGKVKNIALFGVDSRDNSMEGLSDAVMILTIDTKHKKIKLTSVLRDSLVEIDGYGNDKMTHAYAYGGYTLAIKTLNQNFNLDITDYATVNFYRMASIVDAFGGANIWISEEEMYEINDNLDLLLYDDPSANVSPGDYMSEYGDVLLNGNQAVAYARIRNVGGDEGRAVRQQTVLKSLMTGVKDLDLSGYQNLIREVVPLCETSIGLEDVVGLIPSMMSGFEMETFSIPGEAENPTDGWTDAGNWVFVYDLEQASQHINAFIYEEASPYYENYTF